MTKRVWSLLLAIFMVFTMIPGTLQAKAEVEKHGTYLRKMGFCQQGDVYSLELKQ